MTYSLIIATAIAEINENYAELFGVDELADRLRINKSYLIRRFHREVGVPPGKYLQAVRLNRAKTLLLKPQYSLEVISALCGFSSANYFCKAFKKDCGETPTAYRNRAAPEVKLYVRDRENDEIYL